MKKKNNNLAPDFIGIGVMKAATSWIFKCLIEHPEICDSSKKELHFFDRPDNYKKGIEYYKSFFDNCSRDKIKGEYTPSYIFSKEAPDLIYKHFPNVKIVACLRNPVDRAISHYKFNVYTKGRLSIYNEFGEAVRRDNEIVKRGNYYGQLKKYFDLFPRENILILAYEELKSNPEREIKKIYRFLGVDDNFVPKKITEKENVTGVKTFKEKNRYLSKFLYSIRGLISRESRFEKFFQKIGVYKFLKKILKRNKIKVTVMENNKEDVLIEDGDRKYLREIYKSDIKKLEKLLKRDLSFWK
ncbi:sulfotransferase domain-containing protein [bacterium]|nr:sulfotransferase domain-containing protein [bacterium]